MTFDSWFVKRYEVLGVNKLTAIGVCFVYLLKYANIDKLLYQRVSCGPRECSDLFDCRDIDNRLPVEPKQQLNRSFGFYGTLRVFCPILLW